MSDLSTNSWFKELPQKFQDALKDEPVTDMMGDDEWHEVVFNTTHGWTCQVAVVNRKYVALSDEVITELTGIQKIVRLGE